MSTPGLLAQMLPLINNVYHRCKERSEDWMDALLDGGLDLNWRVPEQPPTIALGVAPKHCKGTNPKQMKKPSVFVIKLCIIVLAYIS